jgi:2'-5' RNA ligase
MPLRDYLKKKIQDRRQQFRDKARELVEPLLPEQEPGRPQRVDLPDVAVTPSGFGVRINAGDMITFKAADGSGITHAIVDRKYKPVTADDDFPVPDGWQGQVIAPGRIDHNGQQVDYAMIEMGTEYITDPRTGEEKEVPITFGFLMEDLVLTHGERWGAKNTEAHEGNVVSRSAGGSRSPHVAEGSRGRVEESGEVHIGARDLGRSLEEADPSLRGRNVSIYRGVVGTTTSFETNDYVTLSFKWALGHAKHVAVVEEEDAVVLKARVPAAMVFEAYNPGEYFYGGDSVPGTVAMRIKQAAGEEFEDLNQLVTQLEEVQDAAEDLTAVETPMPTETRQTPVASITITAAHLRRAEDEPPKHILNWMGLELAVEHEPGDVRGREWGAPALVPYSYGYILDTTAEDGDSIDFLAKDGPMDTIHIVYQLDDETGDFYQFKLMIGFENEAEAEAAFKLMWPPELFGGIVELPTEEFIEFTLPLLDVTARKKPTKDEGEKVGVFLEVPPSLAKMWPKDRGGDDESPPHFTLLYVGEVPNERREEFLATVNLVADEFPPIPVELSKGVEWFTSRDEELDAREIAHKGVHPKTEKMMAELHVQLREALEEQGFNVDHFDGDFIAHSTLQYCPERKYSGNAPEGGWRADHVDIWGWSDDYGFSLTGEREASFRLAACKLGGRVSSDDLIITAEDILQFEAREEDEKKRPKIPRWLAPGSPVPQQYLPPESVGEEVELPDVTWERGLSFDPREEIRMGIEEGQYSEQIEAGLWTQVPAHILERYEDRPWGASFWQWAIRTPNGQKWLSSPQGGDFLMSLGDDFVQPFGPWTICQTCQAKTLSDESCWRCFADPTQPTREASLLITADEVSEIPPLTTAPVVDPQPEPSRILSSSRNLKDMRKGKDALRSSGYPEEQVATFVDAYYKPEKYAQLMGRDNVFMVMPSTTGENSVPRALAERLVRDFGGEVVEGYATPTHVTEAKCRAGFATRLQQPSGWQLGDLEAQGKHVVLVDDVFNTGESAATLTREMAGRGVNVDQTAVLGASDTRIANQRDMSRLSNRIMSKLGYERTLVQPYIEAAFDGTSKQWINYAERMVTKSATGARKVYEYARKYGRERVEKNASILITAADIDKEAAGYRVIDTSELSGPNRRKKKKRFMGETYFIRPDEWMAHATLASLDGADDAEEIMLNPEAMIFREGEVEFAELRAEKGRDPTVEEVVQKAMSSGFDAVRVGDRLALINDGAVTSRRRVKRPGWAGAGR